MDLVKIGKYIAGKRKALGLTQKQLAEKIGMSDKSVPNGNEESVCRMYLFIWIYVIYWGSASMNFWQEKTSARKT